MCMWNYSMKPGSIWSTKSMNEQEEHYVGMSFGSNYILLLNSYIDCDNIGKFSYVMIDKIRKNDFITYVEYEINNKTYYINLDNIYTGDRRALDKFIMNIDNLTFNDIIDQLNIHFNFIKKKKDKIINEKVIAKIEPNEKEHIALMDELLERKEKIKTDKYELRHIYKYGLDITFKESEDIKLSNKDRFILSDRLKADILNMKNAPAVISLKYNIFPAKTINEMRSRLLYRAKNK